MKHYITVILLVALSITSYAQANKPDKNDKADRKQEIRENAEEHKALSKQKVDYNLFRRQMLALKEYGDERKKVPALQKASKMTVKIAVYIDSLNDAGDSAKTLVGYITENVGDNSTNIFECTYDRTTKKITAVKATGETSDIEQDESAAEPKKTSVKKTTAKKSKDDDDDDDGDEEKPTNKKVKDED